MKRQQGTAVIPAVLFALVGYVSFSVPAQAKVGETVPQLVKRFGTKYVVKPVNSGQLYGFQLNTYYINAFVFKGVSVAEGYISDQPLVGGEPPNDIVRGILKTNVPGARWSQIDPAPFGADYAMESSDHLYVAFLNYKLPRKDGSIWLMTVSREDMVSKFVVRTHSSDSTQAPALAETKPAQTPGSTPISTRAPTPAPIVMDCPEDTEVRRNSPIVFKDFYLGMPIGCAAKLIREKYSAVFGDINIKNPNAEISNLPENERKNLDAAAAILGVDPSTLVTGSLKKSQQQRAVYALYAFKALSFTPVIEADAQKRVTAFHFPGMLVDSLFNTSDMKAEDFAQKFAESYGIPHMEPFIIEQPLVSGQYKTGWEYTGDKGYYVKIDENKGLAVESVPSSVERKFD